MTKTPTAFYRRKLRKAERREVRAHWALRDRFRHFLFWDRRARVRRLVLVGSLLGTLLAFSLWNKELAFLPTVDPKAWVLGMFIILYPVLVCGSFVQFWGFSELVFRDWAIKRGLRRDGDRDRDLRKRASRLKMERRFGNALLLKRQLSNVLELFLYTTTVFYFSTILWHYADRAIFANHDVSQIDIAFWVGDLLLRGALFDLMEHFELRIGRLETNREHLLYLAYSFTYRLYAATMLLTAVFRFALAYKAARGLARERRRQRHAVFRVLGKREDPELVSRELGIAIEEFRDWLEEHGGIPGRSSAVVAPSPNNVPQTTASASSSRSGGS